MLKMKLLSQIIELIVVLSYLEVMYLPWIQKITNFVTSIIPPSIVKLNNKSVL